ncbi:MAG: methyl-accepting chemotaxis protein [Clostridia bacterium]|nr:methyl-accepting chemotaxis protein [Clostridia bacterium]
MEFIRNLLKSDVMGGIVNMLVYAAILFVFIMGFIRCICPVLRTKGMLRRAIRNIRAGADAKHSWQEDDFLGKGILSAHWSQYLNNLFFADGVYHNASNVEDYINEETVIYGPGRATFSDAVPSLLVSLGFLGTLMGLAQGLSGFSMTDSAAVMDSIVTLIPGMRYAFMTSIFGVVGSVSFTLITRAVHGSAEHALRSFYGAMSRYAGVQSVDPMTQVAIYQQEQTALIKKLADNMGDKLTSDLSSAMEKAVEPMTQSLRNFVSVTTKDQMRFLDAVVNRFIDRMDESMGGQLQRLSRVLDETARYQESALEGVRACVTDTSDMLDSVREVTRIANEMVNSNARYLDELRASQAESDAAFNRMASTIEQMDLVGRQQANYLKTVSGMQAEITQNVEQMTSALNGFTQRVVDDNAELTGGMLKAAGEIRGAAADLEAIHRDCTSAVTEELKMTLDAYQDYVNQFTQRIDYLSGGISDAIGKLPRAVGDASGHFLDQVDRLTDTLAQAQQALDDAVARLYGEQR